MPNQPREDNKAHAIRIDANLWAMVQMLATVRGVTPSAIVRDAVRAYVPHSPAEPDECP